MQTNIEQIHSELKHHSDALIRCLNNEYEFLSSGNYQGLMDITGEKQALTQSLNTLEQQRQSLANGEDYIQYLKQLTNSASLVADWEQVLEKIRQCNTQNEINGRLINRLNQITRETLGIFTGQQTDNNLTYSSNGLKQAAHSRVTSTRA